MASGDVVRLVNVGDSDYVDMFNGRAYTIPAHSQLMVDFDAMCLWLGHPEANNFDPRNRVRVAEYDRLSTRYGVHAKALELSIDRIPFDQDDLFRSMKPPLEAFDMADKRILTVADDPDGDFLATPSPDTTSDLGLLTARLQATETEMANLKHQLAMQQRREQAETDAQPIAADRPSSGDSPADIPGTVATAPAKAPTPPPRSAPTEDAPTRIRVTNP